MLFRSSGCNNLTEVTISQNVTKIGTTAFQGCSNLKKINIPDNLTKIDEYAFDGCDNLTSIIWKDIEYKSIADFSDAFENAGNTFYW